MYCLCNCRCGETHEHIRLKTTTQHCLQHSRTRNLLARGPAALVPACSKRTELACAPSASATYIMKHATMAAERDGPRASSVVCCTSPGVAGAVGDEAIEATSMWHLQVEGSHASGWPLPALPGWPLSACLCHRHELLPTLTKLDQAASCTWAKVSTGQQGLAATELT